MGLLHALINWGIRVVDNSETDVRRIGQLLGYMPLSWRQVVMLNPAKDGLLWRAPDPDIRMASSFSRVQALLVSEHEQVMMIRNGRLVGDMERGVLLTPGLYDISRVQLRDQLEVIWTTTREFRLRWGVPDVLTLDRISIGASGYYTAVIVDPEKFLLTVTGNAQVYKEEQLQVFAKSEVNGVLRDLLARRTVLELQLARRELMDASEEVLRPTFERWGLEFRGLTIEHQNIPEQFRQAAAGRTLVTMEKEAQLEGARADVSLAQIEAQKAYYQAQIEAHRLRALGKVEVEIMQEQQSIGIDPVEMKRIEAAETLAENPAQGTLLDNRPQLLNQLLGQPAAPYIPPATITGSIAASSAQLVPPSLPPGQQQSGPFNGNTVPSPTIEDGGWTREKLQDMLDKLDERLALGAISEQKHSELYERFKKKLDELA